MPARRALRRLCWVIMVALALAHQPRVGTAAEAEAQAQQILRAAGIKGGLVVHLGCGDGKLTAALRANDSTLVHGLDADGAKIAQARKHIESLGLYGEVSVERLGGDRLPYIDNLVNLVVSEDLGSVPVAEALRVLCPKGVAYVKRGGKWEKTVKPWPEGIDEWTHYLHGPDNNAVANDTVVDLPRRMQWTGGPRWARHHDHTASMSALVSANGRLFHIMDEGPKASIRLPSEWYLTGRDAFNGTILWKRRIASWWPRLFPLKSGPAILPRRLVAVGDAVYTTLALDAPLTALDAATGKTLRTYTGTKGTEEVIASDGTLFVVADPGFRDKLKGFRQKWSHCWTAQRNRSSQFAWKGNPRWLLAIEADTGRVLWKKKAPVAPLTLAVDGERVYAALNDTLVALSRKTGERVWTSEKVSRRNTTAFAPSLVLHRGVVLFHGGGGGGRRRGGAGIVAFSAKTGETLWKGRLQPTSHFCPWDTLCIDGLVWSGAIAGGRHSGEYVGLDVKTGAVKKRFPMDVKAFWMHQRCYPSKATVKYILGARIGTEFVSPSTGHWDIHHWLRGGCIYGIMPCNGFVYATPHSCACYMQSMLDGFCAIAPAAAAPAAQPTAPRLERGPAYGQIGNRQSAIGNDDWPTFRHDPARSGHTKSSVPTRLKQSWTTQIGGKLTQPVIADGKVYVASVDRHTVHALDAASGTEAWKFTAGGRVDSPPTIHEGRVLFGSADGHVYALRASDGVLAWRFRAAPANQRLMSYNQLESVWPVHGSVLVQGGVLYCVAGRFAFLDGGMRLLRLNPETGEKISETVLDSNDPKTGKNLQTRMRGKQMPVAHADVLSSDGKYVYMRAQQFDLEGKRTGLDQGDAIVQGGEGMHLFCPIGFLDDSWWHRSYWLYGRNFDEGWGEWFVSARYVPAGRILVCDDSTVFGYGREPQYLCNSSVFEYRLFAADKKFLPRRANQVRKVRKDIVDWKKLARLPESSLSAVGYRWKRLHPPMLARAMALAGDTLFVAGPPDVVDEKDVWGRSPESEAQAKLKAQSAALKGEKGALLWAVSAKDGQKLAELQLDMLPVFDGMAAANGRLYISTQAGRLVCMRSGQ